MDEMFVRLICAMLRELDRLSSDYQVLQDSVAVGEVERQRRSKEVRNVGSRTKVLFKVLSDVGALEEVNGVHRFKIVTDSYQVILTKDGVEIVR